MDIKSYREDLSDAPTVVVYRYRSIYLRNLDTQTHGNGSTRVRDPRGSIEGTM